MQIVPVDQLINRTGSAYKLVILAARRAIELSEGAAQLVVTSPGMKFGNIALNEILEGKISWKIKNEVK
jgi:DNA-directed RNA polymerase omega subunit